MAASLAACAAPAYKLQEGVKIPSMYPLIPVGDANYPEVRGCLHRKGYREEPLCKWTFLDVGGGVRKALFLWKADKALAGVYILDEDAWELADEQP